MKLLKIGIPALALGAMLATGSCKHEIPSPPPTPITDTVCDPATVYFVNDILPIFNSSCAMSGCHDPATHKEGYTLNSYQGIMEGIKSGNPGDSKIYKVITENDPDDLMPPPSSGITLSAAQIALIYDWIAQGAQYNECASSSCDTTNVTYSGTLVPILQNYCTNCHSGNFPSGGIDLSNHSGVRDMALSGQLMGSLNHANGFSAMPQNGNKLDNCTLAKFNIWVNSGAPNN